MQNGWTTSKLGELIQTLKGYAFKSQWYSDVGVPLVKVSNFTDDSIDIERLARIPDEISANYLRYTLETSDVIIQTVGSWPTNPQSVVGKVIRVPSKAHGALLNQNAVKLIPNKSVDNGFLFYSLKLPAFKNYIVGCAQGAASQASITLDAIKNYDFTFPKLEQQRKIAAILSAYDDLIENNTRRIQILEEMARQIYEEWFVRFHFPGYENFKLVETTQEILPEGWSIKSVSDFGKVITGKTPSKNEKENFGADVPFLKLPDMHGRLFCIDTSEKLSNKGASSQASKFIPANSLCVSCIGTAGIVNINAVECQTNQQINSLIPDKPYNREFLYFALIGLRELINQYGANGATMVNLNKGKFESLPITYPKERVVKNFHQVTYPLFQQILNLQKKNDVLRSTHDLLLPKLISGEIDVSNFPEPMSD